MKVLAIGLEPVDLITAAGGTLALYAKRGDEVNAVLVRTSDLTEEDFARASATFGDLGVTLQPAAVVPAGTPTSTDRILATRYGAKAYEMVKNGEFGRMAAIRGSAMTSVPLAEVSGIKEVDLSLLDIAKRFFT